MFDLQGLSRFPSLERDDKETGGGEFVKPATIWNAPSATWDTPNGK